VGSERLVTLGRLSRARADEIVQDFEARKARPETRCVTPLVLEVLAVKR
jgi:hypothetical protein